MVKGIEKYGIPVVHMATVVPISLTIGANRIIPGIGIPYPLGDPPQGEKDSYKPVSYTHLAYDFTPK